MKLLEVKGTCSSAPSWRRHCTGWGWLPYWWLWSLVVGWGRLRPSQKGQKI